MVKSAEKAKFHYTKAAESGLAGAQVTLGCIYRTEKNHGAAFHWLRRAAEAGHPDGMFRTAQCYACGKGVDADSEAAQSWLHRAAETDDLTVLIRLYFAVVAAAFLKTPPSLPLA